jgi:putative transposase
VVGMTRSTYYDIKFHQPGYREIRHLLLADLIADIHTRSRGTYGMLRIRAALEIEQGIIVNTKLVYKIMRQLGLRGLPGPKKRSWNKANEATEEDLVKRKFGAKGPNELWLTDITEHPTREGKVYCCVVLDLFSRKVVGWAIDRRCESTLVNDALSMAGATRATSQTTVIHSDHGTQFTSWAFTENVRRLGLLSSMGTVGDCCDCEKTGGAVLSGLTLATTGRLHRALLQPGPPAWLDRLSHPERIRRFTCNTHPAGHFVLKSGPLNGVHRTPWGRRDSNPHWRRFKRPASADWATPPGAAPPGRLRPGRQRRS